MAGGGPNNLPALQTGINQPGCGVQGLSRESVRRRNRRRCDLKIDATGKLTTVAGNGTGISGFSGDGGPATAAQLNGPTDVFVDKSGNIFIADANNNRIREVVAATATSGRLREPETNAYSADGTSASWSANLDTPTGVIADGSGNIFLPKSTAA